MKKELTAIIVLCISFYTLNSNAQDAQLFDNAWLLENVIIGGVDNFPPSNTEVPIVTLAFNNDGSANDFLSRVRNELFGDITYDTATSTFTFTSLAQTLALPDLPENQQFEITYFQNFYFANQNDPFTYNITTNADTSKTLIIAAANGDQAIYGSAVLNVDTIDLLKIEISPNPVINVIIVKNLSKTSDLNLRIFDLKGQLKQSSKIEGTANSILNVEQLTTGIYFFVFETNDGRQEVKKIVKK